MRMKIFQISVNLDRNNDTHSSADTDKILTKIATVQILVYEITDAETPIG